MLHDVLALVSYSSRRGLGGNERHYSNQESLTSIPVTRISSSDSLTQITL